MKLASEIIMY